MHRLHNKLSVRHLCNTGLALTLTTVMVFGMLPVQDIRAEETKKTETVSAEDEIKYEQIDIRTAEQFADFASKCYIDSWSENKYVSLKADIDLAGTEIREVPVFNGIFDGMGHTISGFDYVGDGYVVGLFRYVESQGVIQNLTLKGNIESKNQKECIGSLCGVNYGTIKNCTFQGTVSGRDTVGGIAGINGDVGIITGCAVKGRITGYYSTGGIAGINHGTLNYCSNRAGINDNSEWVEEDDEMGSGMGILESLTGDEDSELYSGVDTGGIAGFSDGVIIRCTNMGTVGYEHTGYNIGGIAGRQSGIVSLSTNNGTVYGRKDVGGIVGQMEPYIEINEAESIRAAVDRLHDLIDKTIDDMQAAKDGVKRDYDAITSFSDGAVDAADALAEQIGDFVDDNLDQVQSLTDRLDHVLEMTPGVLNHFEAAENSFNKAAESLKRVSDDMGKFTDVGSGSYDVSKNKRITLLHTVGGYIISDAYNPKAGDQVTITAELDGNNNEYRLVRIDVIKVTNGEKVTTSTSSPCKFTMPEENVRVEAYFEPDNGIAVASLDTDTISFDALENTILTDMEPETDDETEKETETDDETEIETEIETKTDDETEKETESDRETEIETKTDKETETETETDSEAATEEETEPTSTEESSTDTSETIESSTETDRTTENDTESPDTAKPSEGQDEQTEFMLYYGAGASFLSGAAGDEEEKEAPARSPRANPSVKITSNLSGNASYSYDSSNSTVTITVEPSGGYTVDYVTIDGSRKSPDSKNSYSFQVSGDKEYNVSIQFKKVTAASSVVDNAKSEIENAIREVQDTIDKINGNNSVNASELQKMLSATSTIIENVDILADIYGKQASDALKAVNNDLGDMSDHLRSALDSIKAATSRTKDIVNYMNDQPDLTFTKLGAMYDYNRINLRNHIQAISDHMKLLGDDASRYSDVVNADLRAVNDQINVIFNLLADRLTDAQKMELAAFYNDVGDEDIDSITTGRAESCSNKGVVKGDSNVGGIAGSMSIDDEDLDDSAVGSVEYELGRRFLLKCLVTDSVNDGYVTAKKNCAGGICGYMDHGIIVSSESYGSVESTEGDYVGGICGESHTIIEQCYVLCSVAGSRNVGGIAGYADTLKNCYSMADVNSENGRAGAIAGQISEYDKISAGIDEESEEAAGPKVSGNYYVGEKIHGIDNISYVGVAEPISYQDLLAVEQLPSQFWHLKVIYKIEDTYLGSEEVEYGRKLDKLNFPQIPSKEGYYGEWPDVSDLIMSGTVVVEAEYKDNVTVVQSNTDEESPEEGQWHRPYALVEDTFTEDTVLTAKISDMAPPEEAAQKQSVVYEVTLENSGIRETDTFSLRILNPYEDAVVYAYKDGAWTAIESKNRGQYLQVDMTGTHQYFCVAESTSNLVVIMICAVAATVVLILLIVMIRKGRARRKQKRQKKLEEKSEE